MINIGSNLILWIKQWSKVSSLSEKNARICSKTNYSRNNERQEEWINSQKIKKLIINEKNCK